MPCANLAWPQTDQSMVDQPKAAPDDASSPIGAPPAVVAPDTPPADDAPYPQPPVAADQAGVVSVPLEPAVPLIVDEDDLTSVQTGRESVYGNPRVQRAQPQNRRVPALERLFIRNEINPFDPIGLKFGTMLFLPSLSQGIRATTNVDNSKQGGGATVSETRIRTRLLSDWSRHSVFLNVDALYARSLSGTAHKEPDANVRGGFRLDLGERMQLTGQAGYHYSQEEASAPTSILGASNRPWVQEFDATLGLRNEFGRFFTDVKTKVDRLTYGQVDLPDGTVISQRDRANTYAGLILRAGYEMSRAIKPFGEIEIGRVSYDQRFDDDGYRRSGSRAALRGGMELDFGEKISGEVALGYLKQSFDDPRLATLDGISADAALKWSPQRGTDVGLGILSRFEAATAPGVSGAIYYQSRLEIRRQVRANLTLNAEVLAFLRDNTDGSGTDHGLGVEAGATYWFNRNLGVDVSARRRLTDSKIRFRRTNETSVYVGLTLQR